MSTEAAADPAGLLLLVVGLAALVAGRARWAFIPSRQVAALVTVGALVAMTAGGAFLPDDEVEVAATESPSASPTGPASPTPTPAASSPTATPTPTPTQTATRATRVAVATPTPTRTATRATPVAVAATVVTVTNVVDGDTVDVSTGDKVRLIGIDTPERGACGAAEATANMEALVLGKRVKLTAASAKDDKDRFGRLVRYVDVVGGVALDAGMNQIKKGLAIARYDSRDGYGAHPRERRYIAADRAAADVTCEEPEEPEEPPEEPPPPASNCHPSYVGACLPIGPDLDCADVPTTVQVVGPDEYRLDGDNDGWGCE